MDKGTSDKLARLDDAVTMGERFSRLAAHPDWPYYRAWLEKGLLNYERAVHKGENRFEGVKLAAYLEGYAAMTSVTEGFDRAVADLPNNRKKLEDLQHGVAGAN